MNANKRQSLSQFLKSDCIRIFTEPCGCREMVEDLCLLLHTHDDGFDMRAAVDAVMARERALPTLVGPNVAMPHARLPGLDRPRVAIGICPQGVPFGACKHAGVVVLILSPATDPNAYLKVQVAVSETLVRPNMLAHLAAAQSTTEVAGILFREDEMLPDYLSVRHMMNPAPVTLQEGDSLGKAIETFGAKRVQDIPIVDEVGDLRGVISVEDLLRLSLPPHLAWMEDLTSILRFEPFAETLQREAEMRIADFMRETFVSVSPDTPAIQLARMFLHDNVRQIMVVDGRKLLGTVNIGMFVTQIFWA